MRWHVALVDIVNIDRSPIYEIRSIENERGGQIVADSGASRQ